MNFSIKNIIRWLDNRFSRFVILDVADSSITLSHRLVKGMHLFRLDKAKVFVFSIPADKSYGFTLNPPSIPHDAIMCDIQYNSRYKCIGFESLCPTVARILFDYGISAPCVKLSVRRCRRSDILYYKILPPQCNS